MNRTTSAPESPIFIVGAPRSGTTLLRLQLNAHPRIAIPAETNFFRAVYQRHDRRGTPDWSAAVQTYLKICRTRFQPAIPLDELAHRLHGLRSRPDYGLLLSLPIEQWAAAQGKPRWGEKTPYHIFYADIILRLFPGARIIALQRDPRAVVASMGTFEMSGHDAVLNARLWRDVWTHGRRILSCSVPPEQRLTVRYEELVGDPEGVLRTTCEFLGEAFDPAMLAFHRSTDHFVPSVRSEKLRQPVRNDPDRWRTTLGADEVALVEAVCGAVMEPMGYRREGPAPRPRQRAELAAKLGYVALKQFDTARSATTR